MSQVTVPNIFSNGTLADANQVNANFALIYNAFNAQIDNTNVGPAGIFASQIIPTTAAQATFGGSLSYTMSNIIFTLPPSYGLTPISPGALEFPSCYGTAGATTELGSNAGLTVAGIAGAVMLVALVNTSAYPPMLAIDMSGNLGIAGGAYKPGGGAFSVPSDEKMKKNVAPYTRGLSEILALNPLTFQYNGLGGSLDDGVTYTGVMAQDAAKVAPETVETRRGRLNITDAADTNILSFDVSDVTYMLINAVKTLSGRIDALALAPTPAPVSVTTATSIAPPTTSVAPPAVTPAPASVAPAAATVAAASVAPAATATPPTAAVITPASVAPAPATTRPASS